MPNDRRQLTLALTRSLDEQRQLGASLFDRIDMRGQHTRIVAANASWRSSAQMQLNVGVQHRQGAGFAWTVGVVLPLDSRLITSAAATQSRDSSNLQWAVQSQRGQRQIDEADDQYLVQGQTGRSGYTAASYWRNERFGQWAVDAASRQGNTLVGAHFTGAVGWLDGHRFATRRIADSFIVVDSGGHADVPVFIENRPAGRTDAAGKLLVSEARAYQANRVRIDATVLPVTVTLDDEQLEVVPRMRAGAVARFDIGDGGTLIKVRTADGARLPPGATAAVSTQARPAVVSSRSEVFIQRANAAATIDVQWPGASCRVVYEPETRVAGPAAAGLAGELTCR